jgi:preprotein translocase subunit SecA
VPIELLVFGRHRRRSEDQAIVDFASSLEGRARVTFHLSFEDPLLRSTGAEIRPLLKTLGLRPDEAITHSLVTRAIEKAQRSGE